MIRLLPNNRYGPIGVDVGSHSVKIAQFTADHGRLIASARWDLPTDHSDDGQPNQERLADAIRRAKSTQKFRGNRAVLCLNDRQLFLQNVRVAKVQPEQMDGLVQQEVAGRLPFSAAEAEMQYVEAADVRQGEAVMREVIVFAVHRPVLDEAISVVESAGLRPVAVDVEPLAILRSYIRQYRRDNDRNQRTMIVHIGYLCTAVIIAQGDEILFVKYVDIGGKHFDDAVAKHLKMEFAEAASLRKHNGDRRSDQQDPVVTQSVGEALRPVVDRLAQELSKCVRYHSVTFRGQPLIRLLLGGGESTEKLAETLANGLNLKCEVSNVLRGDLTTLEIGRGGQWDVAAGLALKN